LNAVALSPFLLLLLVRADLPASPFGHGPTQDAKFRPYVSVGTGLQYNVPMRLVIRQSGSPDIELTARYDTKPFAEVPYYDIKLGMSRRPWAFELELVHHKLYLVNRPPEVDTFEITHGYNPLLLNCVRDWTGFKLRAGAGVVITHPQTTVRGLRFPETGGVLGWFVSGPAAQVGFGREFGFGPRFFAGVEAKAVGAWARVPIVDGSADVPTVSLHGLVSAGWRF
jgi:hypothetical protein